MNITFFDKNDLQSIGQNMEPKFRFGIDNVQHYTPESYIKLLKRGYYGLARFSTDDEEETFLKEISIATDIGIVLEWKDLLNAYILIGDIDAAHPKIYLRVAGHLHDLYDGGVEHDYNKFKRWIKWLPKGYYHMTILAGNPSPEIVGSGLENLANSLGIEIEWEIRDDRLFYWRRGETCARKRILNGTCNGCEEEIRDICRTTKRDAY